MKIRKRTEIQQVTINEYVAEDGKVFTSEQDCREYEETMIDSLKVKYDAIPRIEEYGEDCMLPTWYNGGAMVHIIRIRDEQDVETLTKWVGRYSGDTRGLAIADIGRVVMLVYDEYINYAVLPFLRYPITVALTLPDILMFITNRYKIKHRGEKIMKTVIARMPFNYNNFGSYALTEKGMDKFDELISRRLPECIAWCGDELICDADAPITREDLDINAIIEEASVQMLGEFGEYPYFEWTI